MSNKTLLALHSITKDYPGARVLDKVDFELIAGECHVIFGENGAGKSTLISIVAGALARTSGDILYKGESVNIHSVQQARNLGISAVFQEFSLVPQLSVGENIFLGGEITHNGFLKPSLRYDKSQKLLEKLGFDIAVNTLVKNLSRADQQMVEIAKAFRTHPSVLILDEPTASLTDKEVNRLFELIKKLKSEGVGIIYITHRINEISRIAERVTVLRDGKYIKTVSAKTTTSDDLIQLMIGRKISEIFPKIKFKPNGIALKIDSLTTKNKLVNSVSIKSHYGEVIGLAGLVGSGKSETMRACYDAKHIISGNVSLNEEDVTHISCKGMLDRGVIYIPSDRREEGLFMMRSYIENVSILALQRSVIMNKFHLLNLKYEKNKVGTLAKKFKLVPLRIEQLISSFSGGNQQKALMARCLMIKANIFILDEPTVGIDINTRVQIYRFIKQLCEKGASVILISSDLSEIINLSNRVFVFARNQISAQLYGDEITEENVLSHYF